MSHTNETPNYGLPQYVGTDILNPLVDTNDAYEKIDTALKNIADGVVDNDTRLDALESTVGDTNSGLVKDMNDVQDKIGDVPLTTSAQTLTGAIEEVKAADEAVAGRVTIVENALPTKADNTDVIALGTRMTTAEGNITTLDGKVTTLEGKAATAESDIDALETKVTGTLTANRYTISFTADGVKTVGELITDAMHAVEADVVAKGISLYSLYNFWLASWQAVYAETRWYATIIDRATFSNVDVDSVNGVSAVNIAYDSSTGTYQAHSYILGTYADVKDTVPTAGTNGSVQYLGFKANS